MDWGGKRLTWQLLLNLAETRLYHGLLPLHPVWGSSTTRQPPSNTLCHVLPGKIISTSPFPFYSSSQADWHRWKIFIILHGLFLTGHWLERLSMPCSPQVPALLSSFLAVGWEMPMKYKLGDWKGGNVMAQLFSACVRKTEQVCWVWRFASVPLWNFTVVYLALNGDGNPVRGDVFICALCMQRPLKFCTHLIQKVQTKVLSISSLGATFHSCL